MKNINIIFDTNAYRILTYSLTPSQVAELFTKIKKAEHSRNITGLLTGVTAIELLSHLAHKADPGYESCKVATIGAGLHVTAEDQFNFIPHVALQLQQLIFGELDTVGVRGAQAMAGLVHKISIGDPEEMIDLYNDDLNEFHRLVQLHKKDFIATTQREALNTDPDSASGHLFKEDKHRRQKLLKLLKTESAMMVQAEGYFDKTVAGFPLYYNAAEKAQKISEIAYYFKAALTLHLKIIERMATNGFDMTDNKKNRANTIFDVYQLFNVSDETIQGKPSIFVTNDKWLIDVATECGFSKRVVSLRTYLDNLGFDVNNTFTNLNE